MDKLRNISIASIQNSRWIRCNKVTYIEKDKDTINYIPQSHNSCAILVHNTERNVFVLVKQFRAAAYFNEIGITQSMDEILNPIVIDPLVYDPASGITLELCAGLIDHENKSIKEHAVMELFDELGLKVNADDCHPILTHNVNSSQILFFVQVTDAASVGEGGGVAGESEMIETFELPVDEATSFISSLHPLKPAGLTFAFLWFCAFKKNGETGCLGSLNDVPIIDFENYKAFPLDLKIIKIEENADYGDLILSQTTFERGNNVIKWDLLHSNNSLALLLHDVENDCFLLNRRFKLGTYLSQNNIKQQNNDGSSLKRGISIDVISVNINKEEDPLISAQNFLDKSKIRFCSLKNIGSFRKHLGISGTKVSLFCVKVKNFQDFKNVYIGGDLVQVPTNIGIPFVLQFQEKNSVTSMALMWYYVMEKDSAN